MDAWPAALTAVKSGLSGTLRFAMKILLNAQAHAIRSRLTKGCFSQPRNCNWCVTSPRRRDIFRIRNRNYLCSRQITDLSILYCYIQKISLNAASRKVARVHDVIIEIIDRRSRILPVFASPSYVCTYTRISCHWDAWMIIPSVPPSSTFIFFSYILPLCNSSARASCNNGRESNSQRKSNYRYSWDQGKEIDFKTHNKRVT